MVSRETAGPAPELPAWLTPAVDGLSSYADLLAGAGVDRGLIGPREVPRLWARHLLNCAVVADPELGLVRRQARVADVGTGAGLPGLVWAIARPDITMVLIEPMLRRTEFLAEAVAQLGLADRVTVWRGRAEDAARDVGAVDVVTARAVAPLERLLGWTVPLLVPGGRLLAMKGSSARDELAAAGSAPAHAGLVDVMVIEVGQGVVDPPTTVISGVRRAAQ
jgi:16S rRNA (guanine527-N7)-methyltransferase